MMIRLSKDDDWKSPPDEHEYREFVKTLFEKTTFEEARKGLTEGDKETRMEMQMAALTCQELVDILELKLDVVPTLNHVKDDLTTWLEVLAQKSERMQRVFATIVEKVWHRVQVGDELLWEVVSNVMQGDSIDKQLNDLGLTRNQF